MLAHEPIMQLGAFIAVFAPMAVWEAAAVRRQRSYSRLKRWPGNLAIVGLNTHSVAFLPRLVRRVKGQRFTAPTTLERQLESGEEVALIDVRTREEFQGPLGHIAGARNIPIAELSAKVRELTEIKRSPIVAI